MKLELLRIEKSLNSDRWSAELAASYYETSGDLSPHFANFTVRLSPEQVANLTLTEIEQLAIKIADGLR